MDEDQWNGALDRLESRIDDVRSKKDRKAMKNKIADLDDLWQKKQKKGRARGGSTGSQSGSRSRGGSTASNGGGFDISQVPPEHLATLRGDPSLAAEFDKIYGPGASKAILKGHTESETGKKKPKPEHIDMLLKDPSLVAKFDQIYGAGAGEELLRRTNAKDPVDPNIPAEHVQKLRDNPHLASEFDRIYGPGTADSILGTTTAEDEVLELCLDPSQAPQAPDLPVVNGVEVKQAHVDMLTNNPDLAPKFDQFYGAGAAAQVLQQLSGGSDPTPPPQEDDLMNMVGGGVNEGAAQQDARERAKSDAVDEYNAKRQAAAAKPKAVRKKEPTEKHIQMLRDNPSFAAKFDQVYGEGVAEEILSEGAENAAIMTSDTYREGDVAPPMFPDSTAHARPSSISPLDLGKIGGDGETGAGDDDAENSNSPRTVKWRKENETRAAMGLKPKPHPSKKK